MLINELTPDNWMFFAIQNYNNPQSVTYSDFEEDLNRIRYIKRLFKRYETTGELKTCLLYTSPSPRDGLLSRMPSSA